MFAVTTFSDRLGEAIDAAGKSQRQLADDLGVGQNTVSLWVNGKKVPDGRYLLRLPLLLSIDGHWLLTGVGEMRPAAPAAKAAAFDQVAAIVDAVRAGKSAPGVVTPAVDGDVLPADVEQLTQEQTESPPLPPAGTHRKRA